MDCNFNEFTRDCEAQYDECLSELKQLEEDCQEHIEKVKRDCAKNTVQQAGIWGVGGGAAAGVGLILASTPIGWAALGIIGLSAGIGALTGGASKAADCSQEIKLVKDACDETIKHAKIACEKQKECCEKWNSLMFDLSGETDCEQALLKGFKQLNLNGCASLWDDFKDLMQICCKK